MESTTETPETPSVEELQKRLEEKDNYIALLEAAHGEPVRKRLPPTRQSITHTFSIGGQKGYFICGIFPDGSLGEIFVQMNKEGSTIGGLMDTVATLTSMSLQYGVPLETLVKKFSFQRFEPSGFTSNEQVRHATSIIDYVFRWLGYYFLPGYAEAAAPADHEAITPKRVGAAPEPLARAILGIATKEASACG